MEMLTDSQSITSGKLSDLSSQARSLEGEKAFMQPGDKAKPKNKGGRPPLSPEERARRDQEKMAKKQNPQNPQSGPQATPNPFQGLPSKVIARPLCQGISGLGVMWVGDNRASATPDELEGMAEALGMLMDKWMPNLTSQYGPEMACALIFGQYGLRLAAMKKVLAAEKSEKEKADNLKKSRDEITKPQEFVAQDIKPVSESPVF